MAPFYSRAGILEAGSGELEAEEEAEELPPRLFAEKDRKKKTSRTRVADSPAAIAAVARQDRRRGRRRRRPTLTIPQAGRLNGAVDLGPLARDDLDLPLILLEEAAASNGAAGHADGRLAGRGRCHRLRPATAAADRVWDERGLTGEDMDTWLAE